jgi:uncharacterized protein (TIGR02996 family)
VGIDALLEAVYAAPEDGPRLACADWYERNGQPERARFIRLQCEAARLPAGAPGQGWLEREADELLWRHRKDWLADRPTHPGVWWDFLRGFPEQVTFSSFKDLDASSEEVFRHPVRRLIFRRVRSPARLARCPELARVAELDLSQAGLNVEGVCLLVASPHVGELTWLNLSSNLIGPVGAELLADWPRLRQLRHLFLHRCQIGDEGLAALARSPHLGGLTELGLESNHVGAAGIRAAADAGCWPGLRSLELGTNSLGDEGAAALARAAQWSGLVVLGLSGNQLGDAGVSALATARHLGRLESLELAHNAFSDAGACALAASKNLGHLRSLNVLGNLVGNAGALALGRSDRLAGLRSLILRGNAVRPDLCEAVEARFQHQAPERLKDFAEPAVGPPPAEPPPLPRGGPADEDGLLQAIFEAPDDDLPRLVYADWLDDNGEPERAEVIRLQCGPEQEGATSRVRELLEGHGARWLGPLKGLIEYPTFERGLLRVKLRVRTFLTKAFQAQAPALLRQARVEGLDLDGRSSHWRKVAASPVLAEARDLYLWFTGLGDAGFEALVTSPHLAGLHTLRVWGGGLHGGLTALERSAGLPRLRRLELDENQLDLRSLHALAAWPGAARLTTLNLSRTRLRPAELSVLLSSPRLAGLGRLALSSNRLGDTGARLLAEAPSLAGLRRLALDGNRIGLEGARALVASPHLRGLLELDLSGNPLGDGGAVAVAEAAPAGLRTLRFTRAGLSDGCVARLRKMLGDRLHLRAW